MNVDAILRNKGNRVESARPDWSVAEVCQRLGELGIGALVVSADGRKVDGIVSIGDVVKRRIMETELEANALRGYITTG